MKTDSATPASLKAFRTLRRAVHNIVPAAFKAAVHFSFLLLCWAVLSASAHAANETALWNPHPDSTDIILPMPGGLSMAFAVVAVPTRGLLWSLETTMGAVGDAGDNKKSVTESGYRSRLSAPFSEEDIPQSWKNSLPKGATGTFFYYLIAKYEVTRQQYRAVMDNLSEPLTAQPDDNLPVTGITWYDAMTFTAKYTNWLMVNHPEALPSFKNDTRNTGFIRLPTEAEWEYAAHGGQFETTNYRQQPFFAMPDGALADYAVFKSTNPAPIGSRRPNPLGIYDTAGNAAEMTLDAFRLTSGGRLMGSAGGYVRKGGSFKTTQDLDIYPGSREEIAVFNKSGATRADDLGFRPVVSGINTPDGPRMDELKKEFAAMSGMAPDMGGDKQEGETAAKNPLEELNRLIEKTTDPVLKGHLLYLRTELTRSNVLQSQNRANRAGNLIQYCTMLLEGIRNIDHKSNTIKEEDLAAINNVLSKNPTAKQKKELEKLKKAKELEMNSSDSMLRVTITFYQKQMQEVCGMNTADIEGSFSKLEALYRGDERYNDTMHIILNHVRGHYNTLHNGGHISYDSIINEISVINDEILKSIKEKENRK